MAEANGESKFSSASCYKFLISLRSNGSRNGVTVNINLRGGRRASIGTFGLSLPHGLGLKFAGKVYPFDICVHCQLSITDGTMSARIKNNLGISFDKNSSINARISRLRTVQPEEA